MITVLSLSYLNLHSILGIVLIVIPYLIILYFNRLVTIAIIECRLKLIIDFYILYLSGTNLTPNQ